MKKYTLIISIFLLGGCSSVKISYDYDKQADFAKYKTYAFTEGSQNLAINEINRSRILSAIDTEMAAKGFTKSDNPDVLLDIFVKAEQRTEATATSTGPGAYGYGGPWRYGYGGGFTTTQINYNQYIEGTMFINMVDKAYEKLVWQGRGTKTIDEDATPEKRETNINYAVKQIFMKYPPKK